MALAVTIGLHVALVAGLLAIKVAEAVKEYTAPIQLVKIDEKPKPVPVVEPIDPRLQDLAAVAQPVPDIPVIVVDDPPIVTVPLPPVDITPQGPPETVRAVASVLPDTPLQYEAVRPTDDYYPPHAIRMASEGAVIVRACTDARGRLSGSASVVRSSSDPLLDGAAVKWAGEALRFKPATRAGVAIPSCKEFRVSFRLH
jgi:TonB family protein